MTSRPRCQGTNRQGKPCGNPAVRGRKFCKFHGGHAKRGEDHPNYKHGNRTNRDHLPKFIRERINPNKSPSDLVDLREQIAHQEQLRDMALDNIRQLQSGLQLDNPDGEQIIAVNRAIDTWWKRAELANTNLSRMQGQYFNMRLKLEDYVLADEAQALVALLGEAIKEEVNDHSTLMAIEVRFATLLDAEQDA